MISEMKKIVSHLGLLNLSFFSFFFDFFELVKKFSV
jgi:hypothetical protein